MSNPDSSQQPTFNDNLETHFKGMVLDAVFTRKHLRILRNLIDKVKAGTLDQKYLIGFLNTDRRGEVSPDHFGAAGTMWKFITDEMYDLLKVKYGNEEGMRIYHELFDTYLSGEGLIDENGDVNLNTAEAYLNILENALSHVELTIFVPSLETTTKYLKHAITESESRLQKFREAVDNNGGVLPNGRTIDEEIIKETEDRIEEYKEALVRLGYTKSDIAKLILNQDL